MLEDSPARDTLVCDVKLSVVFQHPHSCPETALDAASKDTNCGILEKTGLFPLHKPSLRGYG